MEFEINLLTTWDDLIEFRKYIEANKFTYLSLDTETNSKIEQTAIIYGLGLCFQGTEAFYIPFKKNTGEGWWTPDQEIKLVSWLLNLCKQHKLIGHNIIYDVLVIKYNWKCDLTSYIYSDTILQKHILDEERPFGLKEVAVKYLGKWADKAQQALYENIEKNGGKTTSDCMEMYKADTEVLGEYCAYDTLLCFKLFELFEPKIKEQNLYDLFYNDEIMPLYKEVTIPMKDAGFRVDLDHFKKLNSELTSNIKNIEVKIFENISDIVRRFEDKLLEEDYPVKTTGNFPKALAKISSCQLPIVNDKITLSKKAIKSIANGHMFYKWLLGENVTLPEELIKQTRLEMYYQDNPGLDHIFNLKSNNHLKWVFFTALGLTPLNHTEKGEAQVDDDFLESIKDRYSWVKLLIDYKKLLKLKSTYVEGVLEQQVNGKIHPSWIQFGPPSGRYACRGFNLQNLPRVKEDDSGISPEVLKYVNSIKEGFIAPEGYILVNADFSQLEPRAFAEACGDILLQQVFKNGEDLYGAIAVRVFNLDCKPNEVKTKYPEYRQKSKVFSLATVYGSGPGRISQLLNISYEEAETIISDYLDAYPGLKNYMENCDISVSTKGEVKTKLGRIRHLPLAKHIHQKYGYNVLNRNWAKNKGLEEVRWTFKNMLNLAKNFPIQGMAGHIVNRAAIAMTRRFKEEALDAKIIANVHDELTCISKIDQAERVKFIMKDCMENTTKLEVPLKADPLIAANWKDAK